MFTDTLPLLSLVNNHTLYLKLSNSFNFQINFSIHTATWRLSLKNQLLFNVNSLNTELLVFTRGSLCLPFNCIYWFVKNLIYQVVSAVNLVLLAHICKTDFLLFFWYRIDFFYFNIVRNLYFFRLCLIRCLLFTGTWTTMVRMCAKTNNSHTTDHRIRKNGSWVHETYARRSNRPAQSWYVDNISIMLTK